MTKLEKDQTIFAIKTGISSGGNSNVCNKHIRFLIILDNEVQDITYWISRVIKKGVLRDGSLSTKDIETLFYNFSHHPDFEHLNLKLKRID